MHGTAFHIRPAKASDRYQLDRLLGSARYLHNHADWQPAYAWLGKRPFFLALLGDQAIAALAAPPDPPEVAWIRLAAVAEKLSVEVLLDPLWAAAQAVCLESKVWHVNCMVLDPWLTPHLQRWGFFLLNDVIVLCRERKTARPAMVPVGAELILRPASPFDIGAIARVDNLAFAPPWQYSRAIIQQAMAEAAFTSVAEVAGEIAGYQISTGGREAGHLARLAVLPNRQGQGIGRALVAQVIEHFEKRGAPRLTVNTQRDNATSIAVYQKLGFVRSAEHYEVWQYGLKTPH